MITIEKCKCSTRCKELGRFKMSFSSRKGVHLSQDEALRLLGDMKRALGERTPNAKTIITGARQAVRDATVAMKEDDVMTALRAHDEGLRIMRAARESQFKTVRDWVLRLEISHSDLLTFFLSKAK